MRAEIRGLQSSAIAATLGLVSFVNYPRFLTSHPVFGQEERELDRGVSDASWHRHLPVLAFNGERRAERQHVNDLFRSGKLKDEARRRIERELDLREAQIASRREEE